MRSTLAPLTAALFTVAGLTAPSCAPPVPQPPPTTTTTAPAATPEPCPLPAGTWTPVEPPPTPAMYAEVRAAQEAVGYVCGQSPEESLRRLAAAMQTLGTCAWAMDDAVMVRRPDGLVEEHHGVFYGNGCWVASSYRGVWRVAP